MLRTLFRGASLARRGTAPISARQVLTHWLRCALHLNAFRDWLGDDGNPALQEALLWRPWIVTCVVHPYLHSAWPAQRRLDAIAGHYAQLQGRLGFLRATCSRAIELADLGDRLRLQVEAAGQFEHEGQLALHLVRDQLRLYSLAFTLGTLEGRRVAYVGALQGLHSPDALQIYRALTHHMQGLRPRDLMVTAFRALCQSLGVLRILAVSDGDRVSTNGYYDSRSHVFASYDTAWLENGGVRTDDGFFELRVGATQRRPADIPTRKRAQYRRRYELVADFSAQIRQRVQE